MADYSRLALGTAQLGLDYGISRPEAMPDHAEAHEILRVAQRAGVRTIDTAEGYGISEALLGEMLDAPQDCEIVTKFALRPESGSTEVQLLDLDARLKASLERLGVSRVFGVLLHNPADLAGPSGPALAKWLEDVKRRGLAERIGVSVYDESEIELAERAVDVGIVQVPASLLDQRLGSSGAIARLRARGGQVHVRSVFLQGLLVTDLGLKQAYFAPWRDRLQALFDSLGGRTRLAACLAHARDLPWADRVVLGVHSAAQLRECLAAWDSATALEDAKRHACDDPGLVDPRRWPALPIRPVKPKFTAILQARMSSTRLPGKVLRPILGKPMLALMIERLKRSQRVDRIVIATSVESSDDPIEALADSLGVPCYRGSLHDVLDRYYQAARKFGAKHLVRVTGDCPLIDPEIVSRVIEKVESGKAHYCSNTWELSFPNGLDVEAFTFEALETAWREGQTKHEREHVTPYIYRHPERYSLALVRNDVDRSHLRWTVDYPEDFEFVTQVYEKLYPANPAFTTEDILALLEREPGLIDINSRHRVTA